jgi:two-component system, NarL family, response regulator NreC
MTVRIIIADDHRIVRDGLRSLLEKQSGVEVVAESENGRVLLKLARELLPDVVIMDIGMPELNGIDATRQLVAEVPEVKVIALSMRSDVRSVKEMLMVGARAYITKDSAFEELANAIQAVTRGQVYLSSEVAGPVMESFVQHLTAATSSKLTVLTAREREVLQLLAEGRSTRCIAEMLYVSVKTVEFHRQQIMHKLGITNVADMVKYAIRAGLTSLE